MTGRITKRRLLWRAIASLALAGVLGAAPATGQDAYPDGKAGERVETVFFESDRSAGAPSAAAPDATAGRLDPAAPRGAAPVAPENGTLPLTGGAVWLAVAIAVSLLAGGIVLRRAGRRRERPGRV